MHIEYGHQHHEPISEHLGSWSAELGPFASSGRYTQDPVAISKRRASRISFCQIFFHEAVRVRGQLCPGFVYSTQKTKDDLPPA